MVFNSTVIVFTLFFLWMFVLSFFVYRMISHYNLLTRNASHTGLKEVLDRLLEKQSQLASDVDKLTKKIQALSADGVFHLQRIGIIRFNPFADTGGNQSFTISLLDGQDSGIVMTSLYARTGNRWYIKEVVKGLGKQVELSKEEQLAIKRARHNPTENL